MENFILGEEWHSVKDYLSNLIVDEMMLFVAVEKGSGKRRDSSLVIMSPKTKVAAKKWTSAVHGKEVKVKDKVECITSFAQHDMPARTECTECLENCLAQVIQEPWEMKMNNFKKDEIMQVKGKPTIELKTVNTNKQEKKSKKQEYHN